MTAEAKRWASLDSLRGIAALLVVSFHCAQVTSGFATSASPLTLAAWSDGWTWLKYTPLRILVSAGPSAVVLFFVLSGFVLSLPFLQTGRRQSYAGYAAKRFCRIYLPFAATILFSAALYAAVQPRPLPGLSDWFGTVMWDQPLSPGYVARNLAMTGVTRDMTLDLVMWSLVHELRISLLFPLLFLMARRWPAATMVGSVALAFACTEALAGREADGLALSLVDTGRFVFLFVAGILLAGRVAQIRAATARLPAGVQAASWLLALALLLSPGPTVYRYFNFAWGVGAVLILMLAVAPGRTERALSTRVPVWLGRVSYSLYLVHLPLLFAAVHWVSGRVPLWVPIVGAVAASLLCAEIMHRVVEVPSMRLGRRLARALDRQEAEAAPGWAGLQQGTRP